jgi:hypothetical protein
MLGVAMGLSKLHEIRWRQPEKEKRRAQSGPAVYGVYMHFDISRFPLLTYLTF